MFDIGWTELAIVALIALLVIGPKELPATMRMIAGWIGKIRNLAREFQGGLDDMMRETELDKLKEQAQGAMYGGVDGVVENTIDPDGTIRDELDYGASYEPFGDFDDPEPEPKIEAKDDKPAAKSDSGAAASKSTAAKSSAKTPATKARRKPAAKTSGASAAKSTGAARKSSTAKKTGAGTAKKTPAKSRAKSGAASAAKTTPAKTTKTTKTTKPAPRKRAAKPRAGGGPTKSDS